MRLKHEELAFILGVFRVSGRLKLLFSKSLVFVDRIHQICVELNGKKGFRFQNENGYGLKLHIMTTEYMNLFVIVSCS